MAKRSFTVSLVALLFTASILAVAALTAEAALLRIQEFGVGTSTTGQGACQPPNPNSLCETHSLSGQVFGSPIQQGTFTGTMVLGTVDPGPPSLPSCRPFTGTMVLGTVTPGPPNIQVQSQLFLTLSGMDCGIGVGPGGGCIVAGTFTIDGGTGQFQGASGQGRFGALIGPNGEVALALRTR